MQKQYIYLSLFGCAQFQHTKHMQMHMHMHMHMQKKPHFSCQPREAKGCRRVRNSEDSHQAARIRVPGKRKEKGAKKRNKYMVSSAIFLFHFPFRYLCLLIVHFIHLLCKQYILHASKNKVGSISLIYTHT